MDIVNKRIVAFLVGCIGTRVALTIVAKSRPELLPYMGVASVVIAIGFFTIFFFDLRKTGLETGGKEIWWNHLRPIHAALFLIFGILAIKKNEHAWKILAADTGLGFLAWLKLRIFV